MVKAMTPIELAIEHKADQVRLLLAAQDGALKLDRLRAETAALQTLIAEAARLQLLERRFDVKGTALLFPVLMEAKEFVGYCLVSNLSPDGMKAKAYGTFSRQQPVSVHFTANELIQGTLVWSEPHEVGVQFHQRIDVARVLSNFAKTNVGTGRNRHARLAFRCMAEICEGERFQFTEVADVSQRGMKVLTRLGNSGKKVAVQLHELDEREATVRWSKTGSAGLVFSKPLSFPELAQFVPSAAAGF